MYIIVYTMPETNENEIHLHCQMFETLNEAQRNAEYLGEDVKVYSIQSL